MQTLRIFLFYPLSLQSAFSGQRSMQPDESDSGVSNLQSYPPSLLCIFVTNPLDTFSLKIIY